MAYTYSKIATYTVGSGGIPSVSFLNIPQNYTDLVVKISARIDYAAVADYLKVEFNSVTTGYTDRVLYGNGSTASSFTGTLVDVVLNGASATASTFGNAEIYIPNYTGSTYKSISADAVAENNAITASNHLIAALWSNTSPISSIKLTPQGSGSSLFAQYSTFHLYGIKAEL